MSVGLLDVRSVVARGALLLAAAAILLLVPELTSDPGLRSVLPWFGLLLLLQFAPVLWSRQPDLFAPPVYFGIVAGFGHAATAANWMINDQLTLDLVAGTRSDEAAVLAQKALVALLIGTVAYYVGYYSRVGVGLRRFFPNVRGLEWDRGRVALVCFVTAAIFVVTYGFFQSRVGVSLFDITQLGAGKRVWREDPTLSWMMRGIELGFLPVMLFLSWTLANRRGGRSLILPGVLLVIMALLATRVGQRGAVVYFFSAILVQFHYHRWRVPAALFAALCFLGITISNIALEWRTAPEDEPRSVEFVERASDPVSVLAEHESERQRFSSLALIMREFPDNEPYLLGKSWASIIALPIPRWLWPDKVNHFQWQDDRIIIRLIGATTPPPFVGVLYANLSWIGVVLGTLLFGIFHRALYEWLRQSGRDQNTVLLYALFLVYFGPSMLGISASMQYILPTWLILRFVGRRRASAGG